MQLRSRGPLLAATALALYACARNPASVTTPPPVAAPPAVAPAVAPAPPAEAADLTGEWSWTAELMGQAMNGTMRLLRSADGYRGEVAPAGASGVPVGSVTVTGASVVIVVLTPEGEAEIAGTLSGNTITGTVTYAGQSGTITLRRRM